MAVTQILAGVAAAALLASSVLYALSGRARRVGLAVRLAARIAVACAAALLAAVLVLRSLLIRFPALTGTYEGLLFVVLALAVLAAAGQTRLLGDHGLLLASATFIAFVLLAVLSSPLVSPALHPPLPILRSAWLVLHVAFAFAGVALFTVGAVAAVLGPAADRVRDAVIALGFVFYATGGLVFGAVWAEAAWGRFWGWDPKETWALATTLVYAVYLHLRYVRKTRPAVNRILAVIAWLMSIFTFLGVNALLSGLHSYA